MTTYAFVDLAYVIGDFSAFALSVYGDADLRPQIERIKSLCEAERMFVYYAVKEAAKDAADEAKQKATREWLGGVQRIPGVHVRLGVVKSKTGRKEQVQKEVDVMLAVDAMTNAFRRNMTKAVLVAGDLDFHPLVQALVDSGCYVRLVAARRSASSLLIDASDEWTELDARRMSELAGRDAIKLRNVDLAVAALHTAVDADGTTRADITRYGSTWWAARFPPQLESWQSLDLELLKKVVNFELGGGLTWK